MRDWPGLAFINVAWSFWQVTTSTVFKIPAVARAASPQNLENDIGTKFPAIGILCTVILGMRLWPAQPLRSKSLAEVSCSFSRQCCLEGFQQNAIPLRLIWPFKIKVFIDSVVGNDGIFWFQWGFVENLFLFVPWHSRLGNSRLKTVMLAKLMHREVQAL